MLDRGKFVLAKTQGKTNKAAALAAGAKTEKAAEIAGWRMSKEIEVKQRIEKAVSKQGVQIEQLVKVYTDAVKANKTTLVKETGEIVDSGIPDHTTRMRAAERLFDILGIVTKGEVMNPLPKVIKVDTPKELVEAMKSGDEVELQRAVFTKA